MAENLLLAGALEGALIGAAIGALVGLIGGVIKMVRERSGGQKPQPRTRKRRGSPEADEPGATRKPSRRPSGGKPPNQH